jgi:hypothetical protein
MSDTNFEQSVRILIGEENICDRSLWSEICSKKEDFFSIFTDAMLQRFDEWRSLESTKSNTFAFWDTFIHLDMMAYLGFNR